MTHADIKRFAPGGKPAILAGIAAHWAQAEQAGIATPHRICHFMAQIAHESDGFATTTEYASGSAYEGRRDLGNSQKSDGKRFKGRGLIQCTGRANYAAFSAWARERYPDAPDFVAAPERVAAFPWALLSAIWYWDRAEINRLADANDIRAITKRINGGYNGLADRRARFRKAVAIWGEAGVNPQGSSLTGARTVKAGIAGLGGSLSLAGLVSQAEQVSGLAGSARAISQALGAPLWTLITVAALTGAIGYMLWDRRFIYRHEGL